MPRAARIPETKALRALLDRYTLPQLKLLGRLLEPHLPTRKFELLDRVTRHLVVPAEAESAFRRALHDLGYGLAGEKGQDDDQAQAKTTTPAAAPTAPVDAADPGGHL